FRESGRHVRRRQQMALEVVGPGVVGTLDAIDEVPLGLFAQPGAAVAANVEQRADLARSIPRDDDALVTERSLQVVAGFRDLYRSAVEDPAAEIKAFELRPIEIRIRVESARQCEMHRFARLGASRLE